MSRIESYLNTASRTENRLPASRSAQMTTSTAQARSSETYAETAKKWYSGTATTMATPRMKARTFTNPTHGFLVYAKMVQLMAS